MYLQTVLAQKFNDSVLMSKQASVESKLAINDLVRRPKSLAKARRDKRHVRLLDRKQQLRIEQVFLHRKIV